MCILALQLVPTDAWKRNAFIVPTAILKRPIVTCLFCTRSGWNVVPSSRTRNTGNSISQGMLCSLLLFPAWLRRGSLNISGNYRAVGSTSLTCTMPVWKMCLGHSEGMRSLCAVYPRLCITHHTHWSFEVLSQQGFPVKVLWQPLLMDVLEATNPSSDFLDLKI